MKFFVPPPFATDPAQAKQLYDSIRQFVAGQVGPLADKRIHRIEFSHDGNRFDLRVGDTHPELDEPVIAILESYIYCICTPTRGVLRGEPYLVGRHVNTFIEEFESDEPKAEAAAAS